MNSELLPEYDPESLTERHKKLLASLPFSDLIFRKLFDCIDDFTSNYRCPHTFEQTIKFLESQGVSFTEHKAFFNKHGVHCDCEVLSVLDPIFPVDLNEFKRRMP